MNNQQDQLEICVHVSLVDKKEDGLFFPSFFLFKLYLFRTECGQWT